MPLSIFLLISERCNSRITLYHNQNTYQITFKAPLYGHIIIFTLVAVIYNTGSIFSLTKPIRLCYLLLRITLLKGEHMSNYDRIRQANADRQRKLAERFK